MAKIVVRLPEPKKEYSEDNQRQINKALTNIIEQLNSTYLTQLKVYAIFKPTVTHISCIFRTPEIKRQIYII